MSAAALTLGGLSAGAALAQPKASGGGSEREESKLNTTNVVLWNAAALEAIRSTHPGPPMVARALAIVHTCIYDAWAAYDSEAVGTLLGGDLRRPVDERTLDNKNEAISYAARAALVDLYPTEKARFDDLLTSLGYDPDDTSTNKSTPSGIGNVAAQAVLDLRHDDGSNQLGAYSDTTGYVPVNDPDHINDASRWQPLRVKDGHGNFVVQKYIAPHWGLVTPFALTSASQFRPTAGPLQTDPSGKYYQQAQQILDYSANLSDEQKVIAEYWADGPSSELPPGHWNLIAQFVSSRDKHDLDDDVKMFFTMTNAIFDASIACWEAKRHWDYVRPITAIHFLFKGKKVRAWAGPYKGTAVIDGETWRPYQQETVVTPPFPEYVSGHSTFSAAGAEILKRFTGSDDYGSSHKQLKGTSLVEPGTVPATDITLSWATFSDAADEAGISRRYGGIHFEDGDLKGRVMGRQIGAQAWEKAQAYISGQGS